MTTPDARRAGNGSGKITRDAVLAATRCPCAAWPAPWTGTR